jgi:hypothetical protein
LERVKDQEKRREQESHNVGRSDIGLERVNIFASEPLEGWGIVLKIEGSVAIYINPKGYYN